MTKPITDKAEVALEYPDKLYIGAFAHKFYLALKKHSTKTKDVTQSADAVLR